MRRFTENSLACSFCHKSEKTVGKLISSPSDYDRVYICDEYVSVCASIILDDSDLSPIDVNHPLAARLLAAVVSWIKRESLGEDGVEELAQVRLIASQMIRE